MDQIPGRTNNTTMRQVGRIWARILTLEGQLLRLWFSSFNHWCWVGMYVQDSPWGPAWFFSYACWAQTAVFRGLIKPRHPNKSRGVFSALRTSISIICSSRVIFFTALSKHPFKHSADNNRFHYPVYVMKRFGGMAFFPDANHPPATWAVASYPWHIGSILGVLERVQEHYYYQQPSASLAHFRDQPLNIYSLLPTSTESECYWLEVCLLL